MSSLFYQINRFLLLEYNLHDDTDSASLEYTAASNGWIRIKDLNEETYQIINKDNAGDTNSIRDKSAVKLTDNNFVWLDTTPAINYLDINTRFNYTTLDASNIDINSSNLYNADIDFVAHPKLIKYDTVKIHILLGYDFDDVDGYIFEMVGYFNDLTALTTASVVFQKGDTWFEMNPRPIIQNGKVYSTFIKFLVPSIKNLVDDVKFSNYNVLNKINPVGLNFLTLKETTPSVFKLHSIRRTDVTPIGPDNYSFFVTSLDKTISIPQSDEYQLLGCTIRESTEGDYFEYFATYNEALIEDYILFLINSGDSWMIQHDLTVYEQIGHDWLVSEKKSQIQLDSFDELFTFRPVLRRSASSVAFAIDYTIKLINADKGSAVYKTSSITQSDPKKYGKKLITIDLSRNPARLNKVYQRKDAPLQMTNVQGTSTVQVVTQTLPTFYEKFNVYIGSEILYIDPNGKFMSQTTDNNTKIWALEELKIEIDPFDNWFLFRIYQKLQGTYVLMDLSGSAEYVLIFNESMKFSSIADKIANKTKGELLFKIDKNSAVFLIKSNQGKFYVNSEIGGQSTTLYRGFFSKTVEDYATKQIELAASKPADKGSVTVVTTAEPTDTSAVDISTTTNPDLTVKKEVNTVEIPGVNSNDGASLKKITPKS